MSELQITLLVIGAVVIGAVIVYNRVQERRFRKRAERSFGVPPVDALLQGGQREQRTGSGRIEPQLAAASEPAELSRGGRQEPQGPDLGARAVDSGAASTSLDYVAQIHSKQPLSAEPLKALMGNLGALASRVRLTGRASDESPWRPLDPASPGQARQMMVSLQLVDRRGAVSPAHLAALQSAVAVCAAAVSASAVIPDTASYVDKAQALDALCAEVDVVVGINVVAPAGRPFGGARLRGLAEAAGFRLQPSGVFTYGDAQGNVLFTLENSDQQPFSAEALRQLTTTGVTLLLDVPRQRDGVRAFDQMVAVGRQLAVALGGALVDDNRAAVTEPGLEQIRNQLRAIYGTMQERGVPSGSADALRLFS
jgi:FtsZ-interacting cell division protein ZipA